MFHLNRELYENIWNINKNRTTTKNTQKQHHHQHPHPSLHTQAASATISSTSKKKAKINFNEKILYYKQYSAHFYFIFSHLSRFPLVLLIFPFFQCFISFLNLTLNQYLYFNIVSLLTFIWIPWKMTFVFMFTFPYASNRPRTRVA